MTPLTTFSLDDLCAFMRSHGGTLTVDKPRSADGDPRLFATQLQLSIKPDGYRPVSVARLVTDDVWGESDDDFFANELEGMVSQIRREHPSLRADMA
jgi:hypothetical protein